jgi:hypothetical protein
MPKILRPAISPKRLDPACDPAKTPRRKNVQADCLCDKPSCNYCRIRAAQRRYYRRHAPEVQARRAERNKGLPPFNPCEMDRKALLMLQQEGLR